MPGVGYIAGTITNSITGQPIQGVAISTDSGTAVCSPSNSQGEYLISDIDGTYAMKAKKTGYVTYKSPITIVEYTIKTKNFSMKSA